MAELFDVKPQNITMHVKNVFEEGELVEEATCKDFLQVQQEGGREVKRKRKQRPVRPASECGRHAQKD